MPTLWMLIGVPGSGKSTWISNQSMSSDTVVISTDDIIEKIAKEHGVTYSDIFSSAIKSATIQMNENLRRAISQGKNIIWDQTNLTVVSRKKKLAAIPKNYKKIAVYFPTPSATELKRRIASRPGKNIPYSVLHNMIASIEIPTLSEGFNDIIIA